MSQRQYCPNCGTRIPPNARFCDQCGTPLQNGIIPPQDSSSPSSIPPLTQQPQYGAPTYRRISLNATEVVKSSISVYSRKFLGFFLAIFPFILLGSLLSFILTPLQVDIVYFLTGEFPDLEMFLLTFQLTDSIVVYLIVGFIFSILLGMISTFLSSLGNAIIVQNTVNIYRNQSSNWSESISTVTENLGTFVIGSIVFSLAVSLGTFLFVIPGIYLVTIWAVWQQVVVLEKTNARDALQRSSFITKNHRLRIFLVMFLLVVIEGIIGIVILFLIPSVVYSSFGGLAGEIIEAVITALVTPLTPIAGTVIYLRLTSDNVKTEQASQNEMVL